MIRRLEWIRNSGIFGDFRWDAALPDLARINVFYGANGSGKTSLARALDATRSIPNGFQNLSVQVEQGSSQRSTGGQDDAFFDRLYVFSEAYIERSHRFHEGSPNMDAVLTLGERTAEAEERIEALREELTTKSGERDTARVDVTAADHATTAAFERVSAAVVGDLSRVEGYRSRGNYSAGTVRQRYAGDRSAWQTLTDEDLAAKKQFVSSDNRSQLNAGSFTLTPGEEIKAEAETLLARTPVTIVLDTLRAHPEASAWVESGQSLHEDGDTCLFCGQPLPDGRLHDIETHFSDEVSRLQRELETLDTTLAAIEADVDSILRRIPERALLFEDLHDAYDTATELLTNQAEALKTWIEELRQRLHEKRANVLGQIESTVGAPPAIDGSALEAARDAHNTRVNEHSQLLVSTALEIERHHLKAEESTVEAQATARAEADAIRLAAEARIEAIELEIASLENVEGDPTPSAEILTREVARLLGRSELSFRARDGRYVVTRDGQPAIGLSAGERTAITLIHFLEAVAHHDPSRGKPIAVVDDPVSSLDSNVFMGISTYIWSETVAKDHVEQLLLLTHNFDLFRQWDVQIESMHRGAGMTHSHPAELYEIRSRHVTSGGRTRRQPLIVRWPESGAVRKKIRSSYHHAFMAVADAKKRLNESDSLENRLDAQLLFPNVIRKILESFLAFKRPEWVGDFTDSMRKSAQVLIDSGYPGDADALRQQLTRYSHAYSHSQTPETAELVSPDEIGGAISSVFVFMDHLDSDHFRGLCAVVGIEPASLLPEPAQTEADPEST